MEARVKERLTGAVVLVAIVVIVVPELLSGPKPRAPSTDGSHTVKIDLAGSHQVTSPAPAPAPTPAPAPGAAIGVAARPGGEVVPVDSGSASEPPPDSVPSPPPETETVADAPAATPAVTPAPSPATGPTATTKGKGPRPPPAAVPAATTEARVEASAAPPAPVAVSGWVVQLGSFASKENAQKLVSELHHKGYSAFISEYRGKDKVLFRVRIGPEQDRSRADAMRLRLGHDGYTGSVTPHP